MDYLLLAPLRSTLDVGASSWGSHPFNLTEDEMDDLDDDLFDDGMIVSAGDVILPEPVAPVEQITVVGENYEDADTGIDLWSSLQNRNEPDGLEEPGDRVITPAEEYVREGNTVAPDGTALSPNQIAKPHIWRAGDPKQPGSGKKKTAANRINVREIVSRLTSETMLSPIEVLFHIMNANEESRHHLGLRKSDRISPNLRAKCAQELLTYMAPKLKSVEVKAGDDSKKGTGIQIFLPSNDREQGEVAEQPKIILPEKDGIPVPFSPELASELIINDDDDGPDWDDV